MRIISGKFKGRKFYPPAKNWPTRPSTDYAKEGLFNILANRLDFEDLKMLDLFGGTGNHSYEVISRGCKDVTYVEQFHGCVRFAKKTSEELGVSNDIKIFKGDVFKFISRTREKFDYIFADPPYALPYLATLPDLIFKHDILNEDGLLVVEHDAKNDFQEHPRFSEMRNYGKTIFSFFE